MRMLWVAVVLVLCALGSLTIGARALAPSVYLDALLTFDPSDPAHVTLVAVRLPRLLAGCS